MPYAQKRICKECGKEFIAKSPRQFYCKDDHYRPCPICGKPVLVKPGTWKDPPRTCSKECAQKFREKTNIEKYGCKNSGNSPEFIEKRKQNNLKKYGITNAGNTKEAREKSKQTCLQKYGTENPGAGEQAKEKRKQTNLERYGVEDAMQSEEIKQRAKDSMILKYGVDNGRKIPGIEEKIKQTNLERYGNEWNIASKEVREKSKETMLKRYGTENPTQNPEIQDKIKQTNLKKYGAKTAMQTEESREKAKNTMLKRYGVEFPSQSEELRQRSIDKCIEKYGHPYPYSGQISVINKNINSKLNKLGIKTELEFPIENRSYDIHLLDTNILLEIDPTYTHNTIGNHWDTGLDKNYHTMKSKLAIDNGYFCIHIFDWDRQDKLLVTLQHKTTISASSIDIEECNEEITKKFYEENSYIDPNINKYSKMYCAKYEDNILYIVILEKLSKYKNDWKITYKCNKLGIQIDDIISKIIQFHIEHVSCNDVYYELDLAKNDPTILLNSGFEYSNYISPKLHISKGYETIENEEMISQKLIDDGWLPVYDCGRIILKYSNKSL